MKLQRRKTNLMLALMASLFLVFAQTAKANTAEETESDVLDALRYGLSCIFTSVGRVNYQIKWGKDGQWQSVNVQGTGWRSHYYQYPNSSSHVSPKLFIRFDSDMTGGNYWQEYELTKYASEDTDCNTKGKKYRFVWDNSTRFIDLRSFN